jgi:hypothetical protein
VIHVHVCVTTAVRIHDLYCDRGYVYMVCTVTVGTCTWVVLWQWYVYTICTVTVVLERDLYCDSGYVYMVCTVTMVRVHGLYCDSGYVYIICTVTVVRVHVLYRDSGTFTRFLLWHWYLYIICIVTLLRVHGLYCDSGTWEIEFEKPCSINLLIHIITFKLLTCILLNGYLVTISWRVLKLRM